MNSKKSLEGLVESLGGHPMYVKGWRGDSVRIREPVGELEPNFVRTQIMKEVIDILEIERPILEHSYVGKEEFNDEELRLILQALREGYHD